MNYAFSLALPKGNWVLVVIDPAGTVLLDQWITSQKWIEKELDTHFSKHEREQIEWVPSLKTHPLARHAFRLAQRQTPTLRKFRIT